MPRILRVQEVVNPHLERFTYETVMEQELWHGTHTAAVTHMLSHGLQPPSDISAADACP
eukprot:gene30989-28950_t